jgi:hypothetical protein
MPFLLLVPALLLIYYYYRQTIPELSKPRKVLLFVLRAIALFILLVLIFNPILNLSRSVVNKPEVIILTDNSYSMDLPVHAESKLELMESYRSQIEELSRKSDYQSRNFYFADGIEGSRTATNLNKTLQEMARRVNLNNVKKIFLLSDGWFGDQQLDIVNRLNVPVWTIHPDYQYDEFDVGINSLFYNPTAYTEEENDIIADVFAYNYSGEAELSFYVNDRLRDKKRVNFAENNLQQITFSYTFENAGLYPLRVEIAIIEGEEENLGNNIYPGAVRVLEQRSGVYILTDTLNWEAMFLKNALNRDERKDVMVYRLHDGNVYSGRDVISFREIFPEHLQMLILINNDNLNISQSQFETLERFVGNGGGLMFIGQPLPQLEDILGVRASTIRQTFRSTIYLTPESRKYQTFAGLDPKTIPTIDYLYVEPLLQAEVLARLNNDEQSAAILFNSYKQGRVLSLTFYNLWRWQLRGEGEIYNSFVANFSAWLSNPTESSFIATTDKNSYFLGETVEIKLTAYDETLAINHTLNPKLYLYDDSGTLIEEEFLTFDSRYYTQTLEQLATGNYSFEIIDNQTGSKTEGNFIVSNIDAERRNRGFNFSLLAYLSRQTNGTILSEADLTGLSLSEAAPVVERIRFEIPLYRHWLVITLFLLAFCIELYLRKKWGLL